MINSIEDWNNFISASYTDANTGARLSTCYRISGRIFWDNPGGAKHWRRHLRRIRLAAKHKHSGKRPRNKGPWTNK